MTKISATSAVICGAIGRLAGIKGGSRAIMKAHPLGLAMAVTKPCSASPEWIKRAEEQLLPQESKNEKEAKHQQHQGLQITHANAEHVTEEEVEEVPNIVRNRREDRNAECKHAGKENADDRIGSEP